MNDLILGLGLGLGLALAFVSAFLLGVYAERKNERRRTQHMLDEASRRYEA